MWRTTGARNIHGWQLHASYAAVVASPTDPSGCSKHAHSSPLLATAVVALQLCSPLWMRTRSFALAHHLVLVVSNYAPFSVPHHAPASIQDRICVPCAIRVLPSRSPPIATGRARPTPMATLIDDFSQSMGTAIPFSSPGCRPRLSLSLTAQSRSS
ncbi:hypothetical protein DFH06DRAFT_1337368 [Mycena polygramma]|nr:hypothetical protein DFH06DRAFT_1337368 [Mycena polygramma]